MTPMDFGTTATLRSEIKANTAFARSIRREENHQLNRIARKLKGVYSKRHRKGEQKPLPPKEFKLPENVETIIEDAYMTYWGLHRCRVHMHRKFARACHLAYTFMRGQDYEIAESQGSYTYPDFDYILEVVMRHLNLEDNAKKAVLDDFEIWKTKALRFIDDLGETGEEVPESDAASEALAVG